MPGATAPKSTHGGGFSAAGLLCPRCRLDASRRGCCVPGAGFRLLRGGAVASPLLAVALPRGGATVPPLLAGVVWHFCSAAGLLCPRGWFMKMMMKEGEVRGRPLDLLTAAL